MPKKKNKFTDGLASPEHLIDFQEEFLCVYSLNEVFVHGY